VQMPSQAAHSAHLPPCCVLKVVGGKEAKAIKDRLAKEHGIMVRHYAKPGECVSHLQYHMLDARLAGPMLWHHHSKLNRTLLYRPV
jgi:hypothetical protein